jgi:hypothetical protein
LLRCKEDNFFFPAWFVMMVWCSSYNPSHFQLNQIAQLTVETWPTSETSKQTCKHHHVIEPQLAKSAVIPWANWQFVLHSVQNGRMVLKNFAVTCGQIAIRIGFAGAYEARPVTLEHLTTPCRRFHLPKISTSTYGSHALRPDPCLVS